MELQDLKKSGFTFEIEGKRITFKMIAWNDAIKAQNAIHLIATNTAENIDTGNDRLLKLALKYAIVETSDSTLENLSLENFANLFDNVFVCVELSAQFGAYVMGFLEKLPTFRNSQAGQGKM